MTSNEKQTFRNLVTTGIKKDSRGHYYTKSIFGRFVKCYITKQTLREVSLLK